MKASLSYALYGVRFIARRHLIPHDHQRSNGDSLCSSLDFVSPRLENVNNCTIARRHSYLEKYVVFWFRSSIGHNSEQGFISFLLPDMIASYVTASLPALLISHSVTMMMTIQQL